MSETGKEKVTPPSGQSSEIDFGATGVFGRADNGAVAEGQDLVGTESEPPVDPHSQSRVLPVVQQPVVHQISLDSPSAVRPVYLLDLLRTNSSAQEPRNAATAPSSPTPLPDSASPTEIGASVEGFTQLIRALTGDGTPQEPAQRPEAPEVLPRTFEGAAPTVESGFTSLLRAAHPDVVSNDGLNVGTGQTSEEFYGTPTNAPVEPGGVGKSGFTEVLQSFGTAPSAPYRDGTVPNDYSIPLTQSPPQSVANPIPPPENPGSFTQLLSMIDPQAPSRSLAQGEINVMHRPPSEPPTGMRTELTFGRRKPGPMRDGSAGAEPSAVNGEMSDREPSPNGITELLRGFESPLTPNEFRTAELPIQPMTPEKSGAPGEITEFYKSFQLRSDGSSDVQPILPPSALSEAYLPGRDEYRGLQEPSKAVTNSLEGPGECTRIMNRSDARELERQSAGGRCSPSASSEANVSQPAPQEVWAGSFPQIAPPHMPPFPAGTFPQQYPVPKPPLQMPAQPASPAAAKGGLQHYVPLMLLAIIFLLLVLLIVVVFLLKQ